MAMESVRVQVLITERSAQFLSASRAPRHHDTVNPPWDGVVFSIRITDQNTSLSYFIGKKPKSQREQVTGPRSHSQVLMQTGIEPRGRMGLAPCIAVCPFPKGPHLAQVHSGPGNQSFL